MSGGVYFWKIETEMRRKLHDFVKEILSKIGTKREIQASNRGKKQRAGRYPGYLFPIGKMEQEEKTMKMMKKGLCLVLMLAMLIAAFSMPAFAASNYTVKATASVNLRKGAGTNYEKLTTVSKGTKLVYLGEYQTVGGVKWYKVSCSKGIAWVSSKYSQIVKVTATDSPASKTLVTTASVNLRKGPGLGYAKITSVSEGTKFSYITSSTDDRGVKWYKVYYNGGTAWISSRYSKV